MVKVAIYGKGGIGKSTISSNLSYELSMIGRKVCQVGCDPKHDSTVSLTDSRTTVLEYVSAIAPMDRKWEDVVSVGLNGIRCIEVGGPSPGTGCAGRGILTAFESLESMGFRLDKEEHVVYDVLGDVVCGGFAVPMSPRYSDVILIVTSGETMSIFAANNILRGIENLRLGAPRVAGIVLNRRGDEGERERVEAFSHAVCVPIVADIPRSKEMREAEFLKRPLTKEFPDSKAAKEISKLARMLDEGPELYRPSPLDDSQVERMFSGETILERGAFVPSKAGGCSDKIGIGSCASKGAVFVAGKVNDMPVVVHGPISCAHMMCHTQDGHNIMYIKSGNVGRRSLVNNIYSTGMSVKDAIFGGEKRLEDTIKSLVESGYSTIFVVTTCVPGMIGDDTCAVCERLEKSIPGLRILVSEADGNLSGENSAGRMQVLSELLTIVQPCSSPSEDALNLVEDSFMWFNVGDNERWLEGLIEPFGLKIGTRIVEDCTLESLRNCARNRYNIMVDDSDLDVVLKRTLEEKGMRFLPGTLPRGCMDTVDFLHALGEATGRTDVAELMCDKVATEYGLVIDEVSGKLSGKRFCIAFNTFFNYDWIVECLLDAGAEVIGLYPLRMGSATRPFYTRFSGKVEVYNLPLRGVISSIMDKRPDMVVGPKNLVERLGFRYVEPSSECLGYRGPIEFLYHVADMMRDVEPGWKSWGYPA